MIRPAQFISAGILFAGVVVVMATERTSFTALLLAYSAAFIIYHHEITDTDNSSRLTFWITTGILLRVATLFFFPNLSDDIYRFIWDGNLSASGQNPYLYTPTMVLADGATPATNTLRLFSLLNSPEYFSVYPPFCQFLFWAAASLFKGHWFAQAVFLKGSILIAEAGSIALISFILKKLHKPALWVLVYALNPLVIIELTGNAHFEGWMVFFMLASYATYLMRKPLAGGFLLGLGILSKLIPVVISPYLIRRLNRRGLLLSLLGGFSIIALAFLPFIQESIAERTGSSLGLYFQKFEFNASIYYFLRWIIGSAVGFNPIIYLGPALAILFSIVAIWLFAKEKNPGWQNMPVLVVTLLSLYFFLSTTVHPWYICTIAAFASLTNIRFPIFWSYLIFSTYFSYVTPSYNENMWIVCLEYAGVGAYIAYEYSAGRTELSGFIRELYKKKALSG